MKSLPVFFAGIALTAIVTGAFAAGSAPQEISNVPGSDLKWETTPEGVAFAKLKGDRFKESYMAMVRLPAGLVSPPHVKSHAMYGIVVSGTMTHYGLEEGPDSQVRLSEGAYYMIPAGKPHISSCVSEQECVTFLFQDGKFDFLPVDLNGGLK